MLFKLNVFRDFELLKLLIFGSLVLEKVVKNVNEINDLLVKFNIFNDLDEVDDVWGEFEFFEGEVSLL